MKRHCGVLAVGVLLAVAVSLTAWGQDGGAGDSLSLFRVKPELVLGVKAPGAPHGSVTELPEMPLPEILNLPLGQDEDIPSLRDSGEERSTAARRSGIDLHYFRLSFSRSVLEQRGLDALRPEKEGSDTLSKIRSLPSMFGTSSPRETLGAIGDIFRPQLNLEIDF